MDEHDKPDSKLVTALRQRDQLLLAAFLKVWGYWLGAAGATATVLWGTQQSGGERWMRVALIPMTVLLAALQTGFMYRRFRRNRQLKQNS